MLIIDKISRKPIYEQLVDGIKREIAIGLLPERSQLPSIRELSASLSVNPNTVGKALAELDRLGIVISLPGRGIFVTEGAGEMIRRAALSRLEDLKSIIVELAAAGVEQERVLGVISEVYHNEQGGQNK